MPTNFEIPRPFFLPEGLDLESLPPQLQAALQEIVAPLYERYVIRGVSPLEVSTGTSLTFLLAQEVVAQFELGQEMFGASARSPDASALRQQKIDQYFRVLKAKMGCANLLQRLAELRMKKDYDPILEN